MKIAILDDYQNVALRITVTGTGYESTPTIELTRALILASVRPTNTWLL